MHAMPTVETARKMIRLHGLQARAIALEHVAEMRQQGDTAGLDRWQQVHVAICEFRPVMRAPSELAR